jgi:hypothetical protein
MDWIRFVSGEEAIVRRKSNGFYLDKVIEEIAEKNTLAHWVRETNDRLEHGARQLTLSAFA